MQHDIDCLNFNDKTYSLHKNLAPKTGKCYHGRTKTRFSQRSRRTPDDGNSSLSRFVRSGHKRASRYHQARSKDQRSSDRGGAQQQRKESAVHRGGARRAAQGMLQGHPECFGGELRRPDRGVRQETARFGDGAGPAGGDGFRKRSSWRRPIMR